MEFTHQMFKRCALGGFRVFLMQRTRDVYHSSRSVTSFVRPLSPSPSALPIPTPLQIIQPSSLRPQVTESYDTMNLMEIARSLRSGFA